MSARHAPFDMPRMQVAWLGRFLAVRPAQTLDAHHPLQGLADACVRDLDAFRRESVSNLSHDLRSPLTAAVASLETLLQRWQAVPRAPHACPRRQQVSAQMSAARQAK